MQVRYHACTGGALLQRVWQELDTCDFLYMTYLHLCRRGNLFGLQVLQFQASLDHGEQCAPELSIAVPSKRTNSCLPQQQAEQDMTEALNKLINRHMRLQQASRNVTRSSVSALRSHPGLLNPFKRGLRVATVQRSLHVPTWAQQRQSMALGGIP